jgi:transcriptional regulator with XRE-family HTH domain
MELVDVSRGKVSRPTFGATLRAARLSRNITLEAVAAYTKINPSFFQDLERDDISKWPSSQFYRESYLRAYADAVGLDRSALIDAFRREIAIAEEANTTAAFSTRRRLTPVTIPLILAITLVVFYSMARWMVEVPQNPPLTAAEFAPAATRPSITDVPPATQALPEDPVAPADIEDIEGELVITSTPPGARVLVNGIGRGSTPVRVQFLPPGAYTVRFLLPGRASVTRRAVISTERQRVRVSVTLAPVHTNR